MSIATSRRDHSALQAPPAPQSPAEASPRGRPLDRRHLRPVPGGTSAPTELPAVVSADLGVATLHRTVVDYANLDHAASTPALVSVKRAVDTALRTYSSVHRGNGYASRVTSQWYEDARQEVRRFVGARDGDHVVFTRNTTDSFNLLARALPRDTEVIVFEAEHHATLLPWAKARTTRLPVPGSLSDARVLLTQALERSTARHRLVVLCGASNVTGELWPVHELADTARRHGARVALDAAQLAPHRAIDLEALGVDYVAFSGHKLYAPFGAGVLAGRGDWLDSAAPYLAGGGATAAVTERGTTWHGGAARHEAGSPNVIGAIALAAACAALTEHREVVEAHERSLGRRLAEGLAEIDGVQTYSLFGADHERVPVAAFTIDGLDSSLVSAALSAEHGIGVRDGKFCAHLLVDALLDDPYAAGPTTAVRVSLGLGNTAEHVERFLGAVASLAADGPEFDYEHREDGWSPASDPRDLSLPRPW